MAKPLTALANGLADQLQSYRNMVLLGLSEDVLVILRIMRLGDAWIMRTGARSFRPETW